MGSICYHISLSPPIYVHQHEKLEKHRFGARFHSPYTNQPPISFNTSFCLDEHCWSGPFMLVGSIMHINS